MAKIENTTDRADGFLETRPSQAEPERIFVRPAQIMGSQEALAARERSPKNHLPGLWTPLFAYSILALAVLLPMLSPGYILTLDMVFTPHLRMPETMSSSYLFHAALHYLNLVLPGDVIQKIMLFAILLLSGLGAHLLVRHIQKAKADRNEFAQWGAYVAGILYMVNPYTYSRFMAGQYAVLLGYALLPFFVRAVLQFFAVPTLRRSLVASTWLTVIGIVSLHTLGLAAIIGLAALAVCAWRCRANGRITWTTATYVLAGMVAFVAASGYWLFPLLSGNSLQGEAAAGFGAGDRVAFATLGGDWLGKLGNILQLQGFWAEGQNLYLLPQEQLPGWPLVVLAFWTLVIVGMVSLWRHYRPMALILSISSAAAITLAITGVPDGMPLLSGLREPQKLVGILAMSYAIFSGLGAAAIVTRLKHSNVGQYAVLVVILIVPILLTPTMFWGFSGQLSPRQYPNDWQTINEQLNQDTDDFSVLSLPWHLYMHYPFAGRVIANPSETFFDKPVIASNELEFEGASPTFPSETKRLLSEQILPDAATATDLGEQLNKFQIKYVLVAKTYDYRDYGYLDTRSDMRLVQETANLKLYRNLAYGQ